MPSQCSVIGLGPHDVTGFELVWSSVDSEDAQPVLCDWLRTT